MARGAERAAPDAGRSAPEPFSLAEYALLFVAYLGTLLLVYRPALRGAFISDDLHYVANNVYVHELGWQNLLTILEPWGAATVSVVNYAPVQMLLHSLAWQAFGAETLGHHVVNLVFHAGGSLLLVPLLLASGLPRPAALVGSAFFLLHPANVEAVAWISQLKTSSSFFLAMAAMLLHPKRPAAALAVFALALLAKPNAAVALPVVFWLEYAREGRVRIPWLAGWIVVFAAFAVVEVSAHNRSGVAEARFHDDPLVLVRTMAALATRYVVLGYGSVGVSTFHEPEPAWSWLDPWWLASIPVLGLLGWRLFTSLRQRREEAGWWLFPLVSFAPVSQITPFLFPFADRYLYFMLPGLVGGALLWGCAALRRAPPERGRAVGRAALAFAVALLALFAVRSHERAGIWRQAAFVLADAAKNYPEGSSASLQRAKAAALVGDADTAVAELRHALSRGYNRFEQLIQDPGYAPIRDTEAFQGVLRDTAQMWIDAFEEWEDPTQIELHRIASAHAVRGENAQAIALLERALEEGGPIDERVRADLEALRLR